MKVYEAIADQLRKYGVSTVFGVMGDANMFYVDRFVRECGGRYVAAAHEAGATLMALGYASVSGKVAVASVTQGPALANALPALLEGARARLSMVLIAGDISTSRTHLQSLAQRELVLATGAGFEQARAADSVGFDLRNAFRRAFSERRPVVFNVPAEFLWADTSETSAPLRFHERRATATDSQDLEDAVGVVANAKRPIVLAGRGSLDPKARAAVLAFARRIGAPVMTTLKAKDLFLGEDEAIGVMGTVSSAEAIDALVVSDCIIGFGASLTSNTTSKGTLVRGKRVVLVNDDPADLDGNHPPDAGVVGDSASVAARMIHWLDEAEIPSSGFCQEEVVRTAIATYASRHPDASLSGPNDVRSVLRRVHHMIGPERMLVTDGGRYLGEAWTSIAVSDPRLFVLGHNSGAIGLGVSHAIGASIAEPCRPALLVTGDGGFMMGGLNEFNTAVRQKLDLIVLMFNDSSYGSEHVQFRDRGMDPSLATFEWPDFAPIADALGGIGVTVRSLDDLVHVEGVLHRRDRPVLIDVKMDPDRMPPPPW
ncbi:thiamine pyrophosphate-binding protein [Methylobacterium sp. NEAU 140]|uniref:thiamine pyrophosphate-binding protein n=1 Tax=Methylobacterium sp. NEAU 140 TaxID=3064945 RepID=UPI00273530A1|nr:thiamine pyrophosphate-binding protein [Methylobacterium sp. NEAU 140]MDP4026587.1 thiamine pyrophosphate-binding protein [Methylobacterium sp. NEAU 140]